MLAVIFWQKVLYIYICMCFSKQTSHAIRKDNISYVTEKVTSLDMYLPA